MQQASYLEGGPLMWMLPLYLHVNQNQKSDYDDDDDFPIVKMNVNYAEIGRIGNLEADFQQVLLVHFF